jgi:hypothetical protein
MMGGGKPIIPATNVSIVIMDWSSGKMAHLEARGNEHGLVSSFKTLRLASGATRDGWKEIRDAARRCDDTAALRSKRAQHARVITQQAAEGSSSSFPARYKSTTSVCGWSGATVTQFTDRAHQGLNCRETDIVAQRSI